jgi:hypothetical protein
MGTLGEYLRNARESNNIDIRDAAQQTRISINYLKALESEDFAKLPGEVFVRGFLKSYGRFLNLNETDLLKRYGELKSISPSAAAPSPAAPASPSPSPQVVPVPEQMRTDSRPEPAPHQKTPIEPFVWGALICVTLIFFLFMSSPVRHSKEDRQSENQPLFSLSTTPVGTSSLQPPLPEKLYLEIVAIEDTWLLVRTDTSPQKKAVLRKGESLIWSAEERFLLSYGRVGDVKLLLNGEEIEVKGTGETPVRDLAVTRAGIVSQPVVVKQPLPARPKPKPAVQVRQVEQQTVGAHPQEPQSPASAPTPAAPAPAPAAHAPAAETAPETAGTAETAPQSIPNPAQ